MNRSVLLVLLLLLYGCAAVGPDYRPPSLQTPDAWTSAAASGQTASALVHTAWWEGFEAPLLSDLIHRAVRTNLELEQARERIAQARAAVILAGAAEVPQVNTAAAVNRSRQSSNASAAGSGYTSTLYQAGFDVGWEIDVFGGVRRSIQSADAQLEANTEELHGAILTLLGDVAGNYIDLRINQAQLQVARHNLAAQQHVVGLTTERYQLGLTSYLDVTQAEGQQKATEALIPSFESAIKASMYRLAVLLAEPPGALVNELAADCPLPATTGLLAPGLPADLLSRRPDLRATERLLAAASADIGVATADLYPRFDLTLGLGLQADSSSSFVERASRYWSIVPGVTLPLVDGGKRRAAIDMQQAKYNELLAKYRALYNSALEDVENALTAHYAERTRHHVLDKSVEINEEAVSLALDRYRRGLTTFLDVLTAQQALYTAQSALIESKGRQLISLVVLYKALGGGWQLHRDG